MLGNLSPLGAACVAAVPKKYLLSALAGTGLGYILLTPSDSFRYIAVVVAIGGIRWLTSDIKRVKKSALFAPLVAFLPILATGIVLTFVSTSTLSSITDCIIEAVLAILNIAPVAIPQTEPPATPPYLAQSKVTRTASILPTEMPSMATLPNDSIKTQPVSTRLAVSCWENAAILRLSVESLTVLLKK